MSVLRDIKNLGSVFCSLSAISFVIAIVVSFMFGLDVVYFFPSAVCLCVYILILYPTILLMTMFYKNTDISDFNDGLGDCQETHISNENCDKTSTCPACNGTGRCITCRGTGYPGWSGRTPTCKTKCMQCLGTGVCPTCGGTGIKRY